MFVREPSKVTMRTRSSAFAKLRIVSYICFSVLISCSPFTFVIHLAIYNSRFVGMYWRNYTTANKEKQSAYPVRSAYPDRQGTSSIFSQSARKNLHPYPLDRLDFCRCHFAAENGEQDFATLPPAFVRFILTAKPSALVRLLLVGFAVALSPRPRPPPKNRIRANA